MSRQDVTKTISIFAQEVLNAVHFPGAAALSLAVEAALEKRYREGCDALLNQLAAGGKEGVVFGAEDHDVFILMLLRFADSMRKGTTRRNLELLGRLIVGLKADGSFHFDEFSKLAGALEGLSLDELQLLATMYRLSLRHSDHDEFWKALRGEFADDGNEVNHDLVARLGALSRTGFIVGLSGWGSLVYVPAPALHRLAHLAAWPIEAP